MNALTFDSHTTAMPLLQELVDGISYRLIMSTIDTAKTAAQVSVENNLPLSSTYKKIKKLQDVGILFIEKIELDGKGKKVVYYRSRIKSMEFNLSRDQILLQFEKNDVHLSSAQVNVIKQSAAF
jgi:predicted transcriptional regulator